LPPESADELLEGLLGNDPGLPPLKRLLIERTGGNPFFLEESVRTLVETKALVGERGAYRLTKTSQTFQIPATAQAILASRIDRLSLEDKRLLQAAAVIGKDVPFSLLQAIAEGPEEALQTGLTHLLSGEFLYEARLFPDLEYTFKHALINDVAYGSLLLDRRRALHAKIVDAIEKLYPDRLVEHLEALAHHAFRSEVWEKASATSVRLAPRPLRDRPTARRSPVSSRHSWPSSICPRPARPWHRPSISDSTCARHCSRSGNSIAWSHASTKLKPLPRRSGINAGSGGCQST